VNPPRYCFRSWTFKIDFRGRHHSFSNFYNLRDIKMVNFFASDLGNWWVLTSSRCFHFLQPLIHNLSLFFVRHETHLFVVIPWRVLPSRSRETRSREWGNHGIYLRVERSRDVEELLALEAPLSFCSADFNPPDVRKLKVLNLNFKSRLSTLSLQRLGMQEITLAEIRRDPPAYVLFPLQPWALLRKTRQLGRFFRHTR
jgi:hypothetical protein